MTNSHTVVIVGGGAAGIATAASLLARRKNLDIAIVEPSETHAYQPGWTMVGGGIFDPKVTVRPMASVMPKGVTWIREAVTGLLPIPTKSLWPMARSWRTKSLSSLRAYVSLGRRSRALKKRLARTGLLRIIVMISRPTHGSW